jgi:hypothetical protein
MADKKPPAPKRDSSAPAPSKPRTKPAGKPRSEAAKRKLFAMALKAQAP